MGLPTLLLAYALGLCCAPFFDLPPQTSLAPFAAALLWLPLRRYRAGAILLPAFCLLLGAALYQLRTAPPADSGHISTFAGDRPTTVEGTVLTVTDRPGGRIELDVEASLAVVERGAAPARGRLRLYLGTGPLQAAPGDAVRFRARLRKPRTFGTPGEFDYPRYLAAREIFVTAFLPNARGVVHLERLGDLSPLRLAEQGRRNVAARIGAGVAPDLAPLVRALAIGDKGGITPEQRNLLARAGVSHLFSISGLHLGLVAAFLYAAGLACWRRSPALLALGPPRRYLPPLLLPPLWAYLLLTGGALPTLRAFLMTVAGALLFLGMRRTPPLKILLAAAFAILVLEPLALFEPAFQLSFAGVLGILLLLPRWRPHLASLPPALRPAATLLGATLAATLATTPVALTHFHLFAPAGLLTNLAAVPAIGFVAVPLGLAGALATPISPEAATLLFQGCAATVSTMLSLAETITRLPLLGGRHLYLSPTESLATFLALAALLVPPKRHARWPLLAAALPLLLWRPADDALTVTALSVGQGESLLVSRSGERHYLVDGGGLYSETFDTGERLVAPALGRLGVDELEAVVLSHDHPDHRKGLVHILDHFPVGAFWSPLPEKELHPSLRQALEKSGVSLRVLPPGWTVFKKDEADELALFVPDQTRRSLNDRSLALYARRGDDGVLLTGDLEKTGVRELLAAMPPQPVTLLKLPHHGSRHSTPELLLERFAPHAAFASVGAGNRYGLPNPSVLAAFATREVPLYRTDLLGTLRFATDGDGWRMRHWAKGLFH